jgi:hypothetical protein
MMLRVLVAAFCVVSVVETLNAQEMCITCTKPEATYRCTFQQSDRDRRIDVSEVQVHVCESVLERTGPHGNCKFTAAQPCDGAPRTVTMADYQKLVASDGHTTYQQGVLEKAQKGVTSTFTSTWDCVASLFGDC